MLKEPLLDKEKEIFLTECKIKKKIFYFIDNLTVIYVEYQKQFVIEEIQN